MTRVAWTRRWSWAPPPSSSPSSSPSHSQPFFTSQVIDYTVSYHVQIERPPGAEFFNIHRAVVYSRDFFPAIWAFTFSKLYQVYSCYAGRTVHKRATLSLIYELDRSKWALHIFIFIICVFKPLLFDLASTPASTGMRLGRVSLHTVMCTIIQLWIADRHICSG